MNRAALSWAARGTRFTADGVGSHVWSEGAGPPVVCLHGVPASSFSFRRLLPELAARGRRGVAFDLPGLGLADRPPGFDYRWSGLAAWCAEALDVLELDRVHLVVHDIGGPIGLDMARRAGDRVAALTVLNTMVRVAGFRRPWPMEPFARRGIGELWLATTTAPALALFLRRFGMASDVPGPELRAYGHLLKRGDGGRAFLSIMRGFERTPEFERRILAELRRPGRPAQVVWGEDDPFLRVGEHGEAAREALGASEIHRVPGRHFVMEDSPGAIADRVAALGA